MELRYEDSSLWHLEQMAYEEDEECNQCAKQEVVDSLLVDRRNVSLELLDSRSSGLNCDQQELVSLYVL